MKSLNKDFYDKLPSMVCMELDNVIVTRFEREDWFEKAWEEYRQHVKSSGIDKVRMPWYVFKKYVEGRK